MSDNQKTIIVVDIHTPAMSFEESVWARPLGGDLYELLNVPYSAGGLNNGDVVRAVQPREGEPPRVAGLVRRGGHRTLLVRLPFGVSRDQVRDLLRRLEPWKASYEWVFERTYGVDVQPGGDFRAVRDQLRAWQDEGLLTFDLRLAGDEGAGGPPVGAAPEAASAPAERRTKKAELRLPISGAGADLTRKIQDTAALVNMPLGAIALKDALEEYTFQLIQALANVQHFGWAIYGNEDLTLTADAEGRMTVEGDPEEIERLIRIGVLCSAEPDEGEDGGDEGRPVDTGPGGLLPRALAPSVN